MKIPSKILIPALAVALVYGAFFIFWGVENKNNATEQIEKQSTIAEDPMAINNASSISVKKRIQKLKNNARVRYKEILQLTKLSDEKRLSYANDWCVASEDLSEEDISYANNQLNEWKLSRGHVAFRGGKANDLMKGLNASNDEFPGLNDEVFDAYRYSDRDTLLRLAKNDDILALITILKTPSYEAFDGRTRFYTAQQLIALGDTSSGLRELVVYRLGRAEDAKRKGKGREHVKGYLKSALAYIEFGMMRQDVSSLYIFRKII